MTGIVVSRTAAPTSSFCELKDAGRSVPGRHVLGVVNFAAGHADPCTDEGYPSVTVQVAERPEEGFAEVWATERPVTAGRSGAISYAHDGEFLFAACRIPDLPDYVEATETAYEAALGLAYGLGYRRLFRVWHYISRLNEPNASGLEVYREFCVGRARALERHGLTHDMPAATVVGAHGGGIVLYFLACRSARRVNIDNPRQVPPYHYPGRYGPRSPNFARATHLSPDSGEQLYLSGTAGILGHRTMHVGDVEAQCRLALENMAFLIGSRNLSVHGLGLGATLGDLRNVKVYVRHRADIERVQRICREALSPAADIAFVNVDICRSDLLVELEGLVTRDHGSVGRDHGFAGGTRAVRRTDAGSVPDWESMPAAQQPDWREHPARPRVLERLSQTPPLARVDEIRELREGLAAVAAGSLCVLQAGDCAESFYESTPENTARRLAVLDDLALRLGGRMGRPALRIGRIGGQYAKPRSSPVEAVGGVELPAFRGHMINAEGATPEARRHDPLRMLWAHHFGDEIHRALRARRGKAAPLPYLGPWSSQDALVMDYLVPQVRVDAATGERYLGATHFPWVGERTGGVDGAQVRLLAMVGNPVAAKIGPRATPESVLRLCAVLDPERTPGRLTLIVRMGGGAVRSLLPVIVRAVRDAGHPVVWLCDPMHGNTRRLPSGAKVRHLDDLVTEIVGFRQVLEAHGVHVGGLHLETAAEDVTECLGGPVADEEALGRVHPVAQPTLCDPRLSPEQAAGLIDRAF
ncbi:FkbO/Hyg5 family chorismatase [Spirillospora sp. NPDC052269]